MRISVMYAENASRIVVAEVEGVNPDGYFRLQEPADLVRFVVAGRLSGPNRAC